MASSLAGQRVVIFGGSSGMGRGAAAACLSRGAKVVIVGRDQEKLAAVAGRLGAGVTPLSCDANDEAAVESTFNSLQADGGFHHVLCTVGPSVAGGAISGVSLAAAKQQFDLKYMSAFLVAKHASTRIADGGSIAFISGSLSRRPSPGSAVLASANAALDALAKALAVELAPRVRVNTVSPGLCDTEIWDKMPADKREGMYKGYAAGNMMKRMGTVEDVGEAFAFLCTAGWVTGTVLEVDGGTTVKP